jgi:putative transposase
VVWTPKYRGRIFTTKYIKDEVKRIIRAVCKWKGIEISEINVQEDHLHICFGFEPKHSISYIMSVVKGKSSKWIKKKNKKMASLCHKGSLWARGYFVSTIGLDEDVIKRYVRFQDKHNRVNQPELWDAIPSK